MKLHAPASFEAKKNVTRKLYLAAGGAAVVAAVALTVVFTSTNGKFSGGDGAKYEFEVFHSSHDSVLPDNSKSKVQGERLLALEKSCRARDMDARASADALDLVGETWKVMKWTGRPAKCTVNGFAIEELDVEHNFRRGYALRLNGDADDKTHMLPWLLANRDGERLASSKRRVLLDLGGNRFETSTLWFLRSYPLDFTEVHAFEREAGLYVIPPAGPKLEMTGDAAMDSASQFTAVPPGGPPVPPWILQRITLHQNFVGTRDDLSQGTINITRFMKEELRLKREDTVIVKMDIEEEEWNIMPLWLQDDEMLGLLDEFFVEIHYHHPSMTKFGWMNFRHSREEALQLLRNFRDKGVYAHFWP
eukprot:jgi/Mesen1/6626/ME000034S06092